MTPDDIEVYVECYTEQGYSRIVAEAFVRADREPPALSRIDRVGFTTDEDLNVLEPQRKRNRDAEKAKGEWAL